MCAYCLNNPICFTDTRGSFATKIDLTDQDKDGNGMPDEPAGASPNGSGSSGNTGYHAPNGGGGITNSYQVGNVNVDFGHGGRHIDSSQHNIIQIETAIANDVVNRPPSYDHATSVHGFYYGGEYFYYSYFTRSPVHINVGTYYVEVCIY